MIQGVVQLTFTPSGPQRLLSRLRYWFSTIMPASTGICLLTTVMRQTTPCGLRTILTRPPSGLIRRSLSKIPLASCPRPTAGSSSTIPPPACIASNKPGGAPRRGALCQTSLLGSCGQQPLTALQAARPAHSLLRLFRVIPTALQGFP